MPERDLNQMLARLRLLEREYPKLQAERDELAARVKQLEAENAELKARLRGCREFQASVSEALNSGDGVYRL